MEGMLHGCRVYTARGVSLFRQDACVSAASRSISLLSSLRAAESQSAHFFVMLISHAMHHSKWYFAMAPLHLCSVYSPLPFPFHHQSRTMLHGLYSEHAMIFYLLDP